MSTRSVSLNLIHYIFRHATRAAPLCHLQSSTTISNSYQDIVAAVTIPLTHLDPSHSHSNTVCGRQLGDTNNALHTPLNYGIQAITPVGSHVLPEPPWNGCFGRNLSLMFGRKSVTALSCTTQLGGILFLAVLKIK
jgi:hypothetical protein